MGTKTTYSHKAFAHIEPGRESRVLLISSLSLCKGSCRMDRSVLQCIEVGSMPTCCELVMHVPLNS